MAREFKPKITAGEIWSVRNEVDLAGMNRFEYSVQGDTYKIKLNPEKEAQEEEKRRKRGREWGGKWKEQKEEEEDEDSEQEWKEEDNGWYNSNKWSKWNEWQEWEK